MPIIFWVSFCGLLGIYAGYGMIIYVINQLFSSKAVLPDENYQLPTVAILIAAYNEEDIIKAKLNNCFELDYPRHLLKVYVVSDGSTDGTNELVSNYGGAILLFDAARKGKSAAINRAMSYISEDVTVFTDANVMINKTALTDMMAHYASSKVGGVSGEKVVMADERAAAASTEGLYWKYESFLKRQDARLYSLAGAAGEMFSVRTRLFQPIPEDTLLDDFIISMNIIRQGYVVSYEPKARASEKPSFNILEEYKRKVRISAGGLQVIARTMDILNPLKYGIFSFQFLVHRVSRWTVAPIFIITALVSNLFLIKSGTIYEVTLWAQLLFHVAATAGWILSMRQIKVKLLHVPFYFQFMHYCVVMGWFRYFSGTQKSAWQKATRLSYN